MGMWITHVVAPCDVEDLVCDAALHAYDERDRPSLPLSRSMMCLSATSDIASSIQQLKHTRRPWPVPTHDLPPPKRGPVPTYRCRYLAVPCRRCISFSDDRGFVPVRRLQASRMKRCTYIMERRSWPSVDLSRGPIHPSNALYAWVNAGFSMDRTLTRGSDPSYVIKSRYKNRCDPDLGSYWTSHTQLPSLLRSGTS